MNLSALCMIAHLYLLQGDTNCQHVYYAVEQAEKHNIEPFVFLSLVYEESRWKSRAHSHSGACGLTQIIPRFSDFSCKELKDPYVSLREGAQTLSGWITGFGKGSVVEGLCGYNRGYSCRKSPKARRGGRAYARRIIKRSKVLEEYYDFYIDIQIAEHSRVSKQQHARNPLRTHYYWLLEGGIGVCLR